MSNTNNKPKAITANSIYGGLHAKSMDVLQLNLYANHTTLATTKSNLGKGYGEEFYGLYEEMQKHAKGTDENTAAAKAFFGMQRTHSNRDYSLDLVKLTEAKLASQQSGRVTDDFLENRKSFKLSETSKESKKFVDDIISVTAPLSVLETGVLYLSLEKEEMVYLHTSTDGDIKAQDYILMSTRQENIAKRSNEVAILSESEFLGLEGFQKYTVLVATATGVKLGMGDTFNMIFTKGDFSDVVTRMNNTGYGFIDKVKAGFEKRMANGEEIALNELTQTVLRYAAIYTATVELEGVNSAFFVNGNMISARLEEEELTADGMALLRPTYFNRNNIKGEGLQTRSEFEKVYSLKAPFVRTVFLASIISQGGTLLTRKDNGEMEREFFAPGQITYTKAQELAKTVEYVTDNDGRKVKNIEDPLYKIHTLKVVKDYEESGSICGQIAQKLSIAQNTKEVFAELMGNLQEALVQKTTPTNSSLAYTDQAISSCPVDFDSATLAYATKQGFKQFCESTNAPKVYIENKNMPLIVNFANMFGNVNMFPNEEQTTSKGDKVVRAGVFIAGELNRKQRRELDKSNGFSALFRTPTPGVNDGAIARIYTKKDLPEAFERLDSTNIVPKIMEVLNCTEAQAHTVSKSFKLEIKKFYEELTQGLVMDAHEDLMEALGGADFDTDTVFAIFSSSFTKAVSDTLRTTKRNFKSLGFIEDKEKVDLEKFDEQVVNSFYRICRGTTTSVGIETSKIDNLITLMYLIRQGGEKAKDIPALLAEWVKALVDVTKVDEDDKPIAISMSDTYTSPIEYVKTTNSLGYQVYTTTMSKDIILKTKIAVCSYKFASSKTPFDKWTPSQRMSVIQLLQDCTVVGAFVGDAVIDASKKLYNVAGIELPKNVFKSSKAPYVTFSTEKQADVVLENGRTASPGLNITIEPVEDSEVLGDLEYRSYISQLGQRMINALKGKCVVSITHKVNEECFEKGKAILDRLQSDITTSYSVKQLKSTFNMYSGLIKLLDGTANEEYREGLESLNYLIDSLFEDKTEIFPALYAWNNGMFAKSDTKPFNLAGDNLLAYFHGDVMLPSNQKVDEDHKVNGLVLPVNSYVVDRENVRDVIIKEFIHTSVDELGFTDTTKEYVPYVRLNSMKDDYEKVLFKTTPVVGSVDANFIEAGIKAEGNMQEAIASDDHLRASNPIFTSYNTRNFKCIYGISVLRNK